jgi:dTDP-4-amino-4,6-dideoxygalactose transaminase
MCLSFTGPYKHLKLGKGGAILTDDINAYYWFKRARFSGRQECSYHEDDFDSTEAKDKDGYSVAFVPPIAGWNFYMMPEIAARGLQMMTQFYNQDGTPKHNKDLCLPYPDLSRFSIFKQ